MPLTYEPFHCPAWPPPTISLEVMRTLASLALALVLAGCSTPAPVATVTATATATTTTTVDPNFPEPSPTESPTSTVNENGNVVKKPGEMAGIMNEETGEFSARFKVVKIQKNFKCNSGYSDKSANGHYVGIWMGVWTTKTVGDDATDYIPYFNTDEWSVVGPSGVTENDSSGNGYSCAKESIALPSQITGAKHLKGVVVIDTKYTSGSLVFTQDYMDGGGWEYDY